MQKDFLITPLDKPCRSPRTLLVGGLAALVLCVSAWAAQPSPRKAQTESATTRLTDHEVRREKFKQLCANPTPSQRETLEILAKGEGQTLGPEFCDDVEYYYFGSISRPREMTRLGFKPHESLRDISVFQYFTGLQSFGVDDQVQDLSPLIHLKSLERLGIGSNKHTLDISVIAHLKNLKHLSLADTQVVSLAPLAALKNLQTLNLHMDRHKGLQGRKGLDALRHLTSLTQLDIDVAEPMGDQLKDLRQLKSLVIYGPVKDVCSLNNLTQLSSLYLINSGIHDVSCLKGLKELANIAISGNPIKSIDELAPLLNLRNLSIEHTLIEDLSALTNNPNMYIVEAEGTPLRWCSPKTAKDIKKGVSCFNSDGSEKPWWKRALRQ